MPMWKRKPVVAEVDGREIACVICGAAEFVDRPVKLNSTAAELFDLAWANQTATGLICTNCGYVHEFVGGRILLYESS
jgi:predicted nucleic-acid-binding Zn-ribbon protein